MKAKTPKNEKIESSKCKCKGKMAWVSDCKGVVCRGANALGYLGFAKKIRAKKWVRCYNIGVERSGKKISRSREKQVIFRLKGVLDMTAVFVFAALVIVNIAYCVYDGRRADAARQIDDFYRVEFKKTYGAKEKTLTESWY